MTIDRQVELNTKAIKLLAAIVDECANGFPIHVQMDELNFILDEFDADEAEAGK